MFVGTTPHAIPTPPRAAEAAPPREPAPRASEPAPRIVPPATPVVAPPPRATEPVSRPSEPAARVPPPTALPRQEPPARAAGRRQQGAPLPPLPLDAVLGTILFSPERKLAIVDGRIVSVGDEVKGAIIVEITPSSVLLRDGQGRMRSLTLGGSGR